MLMSAAARLARHLKELTPAQMAALSDRAGVQRNIGARARAGRKVSATAYLLLCSAAGVDIATGAPVVVRGPCAGCSIVWWIFGSALFLTRSLRRLDLRSAADRVGVSAATLSRAERGQPIAIESYLRVANFIGVPSESFMSFAGNPNCNTLKPNDSKEVRLGDRESFALVDAGTVSSRFSSLNTRSSAS
jgi:transcriptional regulator with XRE-family HTH domain